ncbi:MAG: DNA primase [Chloroflexi bacterium]|nr:DNA primase [Chloroflexota bacterium]
MTQEIKSRLDLIDFVSETVSLRKSGRNYAGFCPFHSNTRTPAFFVFPETQTWRCFGACAEGGDVFSFLMKRDGMDFKEALTILAQRAGVELKPFTPEEKKRRTHEEKLTDLLAAAADYFHQLFLHAPQSEGARGYINGRSLSDTTSATFKIGFALNSWNACRAHFNAQGYSDSELVEVGLLTENEEKGTKYDRFRNRLMIPIRNSDGRTVGFGARTLDKDGIPKYLNSPQTAVFDKSHLLFGLDMARRDIREARQAVIVEGYMDVMQAWQAGFRNVVAQMGTALTEAQLTQLKRYTRRFVLALDADAAGAKATLRSLQVARQTLDREVEVKFDARGLVQHEGRLQADIRIVTLPEGEDPDSIIRQEVARWPQLVSQAKPVVAYVIDVATKDLDMNDAKAKTAVAQQVIPLIKDINEPLERDHYWQQLARALRVDERALRQIRLTEKPAPAKQAPAPKVKKTKGNAWTAVPRQAMTNGSSLATGMRQSDYLGQCLQNSALIRMVNERLENVGQTAVRETDFNAPEDRAITRHLYQWIDGRAVAPIDELWDILDTTLTNRVQFLLSLPPASDAELERLADTLVLSVLDWRLEKARQLLNEVKQFIKESQIENDQDVLTIYQQQLRELPLTVLQINKARSSMSATNRRRAADTVRYQ